MGSGKKKDPSRMPLELCLAANVTTLKSRILWAVICTVYMYVHDSSAISSCLTFFEFIQEEMEQQDEKTRVSRHSKNEAVERRPMITPALREALTRQGEHS